MQPQFEDDDETETENELEEEEEKVSPNLQYDLIDSDNDKLNMEESESCDEEMNAQFLKESNIMANH